MSGLLPYQQHELTYVGLEGTKLKMQIVNLPSAQLLNPNRFKHYTAFA